MAILGMKSGDLEIKIVDENGYNCTIIDKTKKILQVKINNKIFDLNDPTKSDFSYKRNFNKDIGYYVVDENFVKAINNKPPKDIGIIEKKGTLVYIYVKYLTNNINEIKITNDDNQTSSTYNIQAGNLNSTEKRENDKEKQIIYPTQGTFTYQKETPKQSTTVYAEINKLKVEKYNLEQELKKTKEALEKVTQSKYGQNELVNSLKEEIQKLEREKRDIEYELSTLKRKFEEINKNNADLGINIKAKDEQFISLRNEKSKLETENEKLKDELNNKTAALDIKTTELYNKITELEKIKDEKEGLEQAKDDEERKIRAEYGNIKPNTNLINEYEKLKAELNNKINELEKIKNETNGNISTNRMNDIILKQINDNVNRLISYQFANTGDGTLHFTKLTEVISELLKTVQTIETKLKK